jgi:hypothetical protein
LLFLNHAFLPVLSSCLGLFFILCSHLRCSLFLISYFLIPLFLVSISLICLLPFRSSFAFGALFALFVVICVSHSFVRVYFSRLFVRE